MGWGTFPLLDADFNINEGKFKVPLLFGTVDPSFDKYIKLEQKMAEDLDNWVGNLYFEIEKINLTDIKLDPASDKLYYQPIATVSEESQILRDVD